MRLKIRFTKLFFSPNCKLDLFILIDFSGGIMSEMYFFLLSAHLYFLNCLIKCITCIKKNSLENEFFSVLFSVNRAWKIYF